MFIALSEIISKIKERYQTIESPMLTEIEKINALEWLSSVPELNNIDLSEKDRERYAAIIIHAKKEGELRSLDYVLSVIKNLLPEK